MKHLQLIIQIVATNAACIILISSIILYKRNKQKQYLYRGFIVVSFMLIFIPSLIVSYFYNIKESLFFSFFGASQIGIISLIPSLILYANEITKPQMAKQLNSASIIVSVILLFPHFVLYFLQSRIILFGIIMSLILGASILYLGLILIKGQYVSLTKAISNNRKLIGIIAMIFLPFFFLVDILSIIDLFELWNLPKTLFVTPVFFILWAICFIREDMTTLAYKRHTRSYDDFCSSYNLTPREIETGELLLKGYTYDEIATTLFVSKETIKSHIKNIYSKTGVNSKMQLFSSIDQFVANV